MLESGLFKPYELFDGSDMKKVFMKSIMTSFDVVQYILAVYHHVSKR